MDYCHQCRRHLNGALACAGCGTPVEELRYETPQAAAPRAVAAERVEHVEHGARAEREGRAEHVYELDPLEPPRVTSQGGRAAARRGAVPSGRAGARRSRRARSRKGRNVVVGTLGIVLAAGALSMAKMALEPPGEGGAATAVQEEEAVETSLPPLPSQTAPPTGGTTPVHVTKSAEPRDTDTPAPGHTGIPGAGSGGSGSGSGSGGGGAVGGSGAGSDGGQGGTAEPSTSPTASEPQPGTTPTPTGSGSATATPPGEPPAPTTPTATPSPEKSCWFIFCF
ncbi:hypothetical protein [Streptomyces sp. NPDC013457]|uniref:SCO2400 family protein n=1 Tax=Streptomyces sp. NPDC013457 TaxID=3364866 RepID=UPI0036F99320